VNLTGGFEMSKAMNIALQVAVNQEEVLFPHAAVDILKDVYGKRLDAMRPATIYDKVEALCMKNGYEPERQDVVEAVNNFIGDF
jgi:hypothetical protein